LNEAKFINKSLSALGNVINALTSTLQSGLATSQHLADNSMTPSTKHIPYRDSKLTRLLQDSLSGNSKTILFLTVSLSIEHLPETLSTLRFGERARKLRTKPKINIELNDLNTYKQSYIKLEKQFLSLKGTIDELRKELIEKDRIIEELRAREVRSTTGGESSQTNCSNCAELNAIIQNLKMTVVPKVTTGTLSQSPRIPIKSPSKIPHSPIQELPVSDETRCAVCGLNEVETEQLREDTGESLGGFFTCDGNCGNIFHVRCAGEIGEGGQYTVPSGEWYCTTCSVVDDETDLVKNLNLAPDGQMASLCVSDSKPLGDDSDQNDPDQHQNLRILSEYHKIRRERNRILNQWQHEQRLLKQRNDLRDTKEFELNQELITAKEIINKLQDDACRSHRTQKSLEKRLSDAVQELLLLKNERMKEENARRQGDEAIPSNPSSPPASQASYSPNNARVQPLLPSSKLYPSIAPPVAEIPKPWLKKSSGKKANSAISDNSKGESLGSTLPSPTANSESLSSQSKRKHRLPTSPIRQNLVSNPPLTSLSLETPSPLMSENITDHITSSSTLPSKSPFNKRLINLIQIVKEETGSFAEIRKKYKERETERSMLKSRHHAFPLASEESFENTFVSES
jgi:hypothetical protein